MNKNNDSLFWWIVANGLTTLRLLIAFYILFWSPTMEVFLCLIIIGGITDILDGLAAGQGGRTRQGAIYDKGVDKFFCAVILGRFLYICVVGFGWTTLVIFLFIFVALVIFLEALISVAGIIFASYNRTRVEANIWGKIKMWAEVLTAGFAILFLERNTLPENAWLIFIGLGLSLLFGFISLITYVLDYKRLKEKKIKI
ncbi:CDP-alcohol phosphatidyltransferase family protein [Patescibacteria group bacterium]|nr:CDP-alcohol phosphatidyltransferase family protein [Patescibacteria group bacterium]